MTHHQTTDRRIQCNTCHAHAATWRVLTMLHGHWFCPKCAPKDGDGD